MTTIAKVGFQINALSSASGWPIFMKRRFDWLRALAGQHQFETFSNHFNKTITRAAGKVLLIRNKMEVDDC